MFNKSIQMNNIKIIANIKLENKTQGSSDEYILYNQEALTNPTSYDQLNTFTQDNGKQWNIDESLWINMDTILQETNMSCEKTIAVNWKLSHYSTLDSRLSCVK